MRPTPEIIEQMHEFYTQGNSFAIVAKKFGVSREMTHYYISRLKDYKPNVKFGVPLKEEDCVYFNGMRYTPGKGGYYRCTQYPRHSLSQAVFCSVNEPLKDGEQIGNKSGDKKSTDPENYYRITAKMRNEIMNRLSENAGRFKPKYKIGDTRMWKKYEMVKIGENTWQSKERYEYEQINGKIPQNLQLYKGQLFTKQELHTLIKNDYPLEFADIIKDLLKLKNLIKEKQNGKDEN